MAAARKAKVDLVSTVDQAVAAMHWLTPADQVTVELARKYAAEIEDAAIRDAEVRPCTLALAVYTSYSAWAALRCFIGMSDQMSMVAADSPSGTTRGSCATRVGHLEPSVDDRQSRPGRADHQRQRGGPHPAGREGLLRELGAAMSENPFVIFLAVFVAMLVAYVLIKVV